MGEIIDDMVSTIVAAIPEYGTLDRSQLVEVGAITRWVTTRMLDLWVNGGHLDQQDLERFRGIGAARAVDGRPLPSILRGYRVGASRAIDVLMERHGTELDVTDVADAARLWLASVDRLSEAIYRGYEATIHRHEDDRDLAVSHLLRDLLTGRHSSPGVMAERCRALDIVLPELPSLIVATSIESAGVPIDAVQLAEAAAGRSGDGPGSPHSTGAGATTPALSAVREPYAMALTDPVDLPTLATYLAGHGLVACVMRQQSPDALPRAFRLATHCLDRAPAHAWWERRVLSEGDAEVLALIGNHQDADADAVSATVLRDLRDTRNAHIVAGLDAFLGSRDATVGARLIGVHPQTMRYRIRKVLSLTGRDPREPWDRFILQVASTAHVAGTH